MSLARIIGILVLCSLAASCVIIPKNAFKLSPTSIEDRQQQTRLFETQNELELLIAGTGVLQDMGFSLDESEKDLGLITASKTVDATDAGQIVAAIFVAALTGSNMPIEKEQKIRVSLVTRPSTKNKDSYLARITFQRIIWNTQGQISRVETLKDPELYQAFFDKLSKSVFLEAHKI